MRSVPVSTRSSSDQGGELTVCFGWLGLASSWGTSGPRVRPRRLLHRATVCCSISMLTCSAFMGAGMDLYEQETPDFKSHTLPLARIKKVMKMDEDVKVRALRCPPCSRWL